MKLKELVVNSLPRVKIKCNRKRKKSKDAQVAKLEDTNRDDTLAAQYNDFDYSIPRDHHETDYWRDMYTKKYLLNNRSIRSYSEVSSDMQESYTEDLQWSPFQKRERSKIRTNPWYRSKTSYDSHISVENSPLKIKTCESSCCCQRINMASSTGSTDDGYESLNTSFIGESKLTPNFNKSYEAEQNYTKSAHNSFNVWKTFPNDNSMIEDNSSKCIHVLKQRNADINNKMRTNKTDHNSNMNSVSDIERSGYEDKSEPNMWDEICLSSTTTNDCHNPLALLKELNKSYLRKNSVPSYQYCTSLSQSCVLDQRSSSLYDINDGLCERLAKLRKDKSMVKEKIIEAREEREKLRKIKPDNQFSLHRQFILLDTLNELKERLQKQNYRLQNTHDAILSIQKRLDCYRTFYLKI